MASEVPTVGDHQSLEELRRELAEAREQQAAAAEILRVISSSPRDLQRVLSEIAASAGRLCDAYDVVIQQVDGDFLGLVAHYGPIPVPNRLPLTREIVGGRAFLDRQLIHVADLQAEIDEYPENSDLARRLGYCTILAVPLSRAGNAIGVIAIRRTEVRPFSDKQIALLKTFADQAVVAIENTQLFEAEQASKRELTEALEQQTAASDVLSVISRSKFDPQPVFDTMAENAVRLCQAERAFIFRFDGTLLRAAASYNVGPELKDFVDRNPIAPGRHSVSARAAVERRTVHVPDVQSDPEYAYAARDVDLIRTILAVPLMRGDDLLGTITIYKVEVKPFTDKQIELIQTFADQAVIAIENTRLFEAEQASKRELQESLEYQTATSNVLGVISRSPTDVQPVFESIAQSAAQLCGAQHCNVFRFDGQLIHFAATHLVPGMPPEARVANMRQPPIAPGRGNAAARSIAYGTVAEIPDIDADPDYERKEATTVSNLRSTMAAPMLKDGSPIGAIVVSRSEKGRFSERQIELLKTFADQAVIAIENTRLFEEVQARTRELTEALEHQTATSDVLGVIAASPTDIQPVLQTLVESACRLCAAYDGIILLREGDWLQLKAHHGPIAVNASKRKITRDWVNGRCVADRVQIHVHNLQAEVGEYPEGAALARRLGARTILSTPLMREGEAIGAIMIRRDEMRPFSDKQIGLLETFARQAVIAIENTRLFEAEQARTREVMERTRELTEALEQQTATADVLKVISRSALDLQRVLDALVESAARLCNAHDAAILQVFGDGLRLVAHHGQIPMPDPVGQHTVPLVRGLIAGRAVIDRRTIQVADILAEADEYAEGRKLALQLSWRTGLGVPLVHAGEAIGVILIRRAEVRPFTQRQIELVNTFADQAVIAIENTRLLNELRESLQQQTATADVLKVISRSTFDLQAVLNALVESAARLCGSEDVSILRLEGDNLLRVAHCGPMRAAIGYVIPAVHGTVNGRSLLERRPIHVADLQAESETYPEGSAIARDLGHRTVLVVPLLREGAPLGAINLRRNKVAPFSDKQIDLVTTFADQAVIAIENARLFEEVQARNRDLTALGEVGRAVSSTLDLKVVLKTIVDRAVELSGTDAGSIFYYRDGRFELGETTGIDEHAITRIRKLDIAAGQTGLGEVIARRQPLQVPDIFQRPSNPLRDTAIEAGLRAGLIVPLFGSEGPLGALVLQRRRPGEFPPAVVSLMQSFADQSAIALENARLFNEIAQKSRELEIASQHKSQFVANMSHELRTPLAAILGYAELMQEGFYEPLGEKSMDALTRIRSNGKHLLGLINAVLDIAKIESGQFSLNIAEYALDGVVETVRAATESLAQSKKLALKTEVAKPLPVGRGDEQRLTQVLLNLVGNAIKFTDAGEVRVTAKADNGRFAVSVADTGPGIPEHERSRIFEQFHQIDSSNTKAKGGAGLGLAIAKQIVEMHGGRIWVESVLGKGSTFLMELPTRTEFRNIAP